MIFWMMDCFVMDVVPVACLLKMRFSLVPHVLKTNKA